MTTAQKIAIAAILSTAAGAAKFAATPCNSTPPPGCHPHEKKVFNICMPC